MPRLRYLGVFGALAAAWLAASPPMFSQGQGGSGNFAGSSKALTGNRWRGSRSPPAPGARR